MKLKKLLFIGLPVSILVGGLCTAGYLKWKRKHSLPATAAQAGAEPTKAPSRREVRAAAEASSETGVPMLNTPNVGQPDEKSVIINPNVPPAAPNRVEMDNGKAKVTMNRGLIPPTQGQYTDLDFTISHLRNRSSEGGVMKTVAGAVGMSAEDLSALEGVSPELAKEVKRRLAGLPQAIKTGGGTPGPYYGGSAFTGGVQRRPVAHPSPFYLHAGTLVEIQLINTLESFAEGSPILGVVVHDVVALNGNIVIPAGSRYLGHTAGSDKDRIFGAPDGRIVITDGEFFGRSLPIYGKTMTAQNAFLLDKKGKAEFIFFGSDDMKVGIVGHLIVPQNWNEAKLFLSEAIKNLTPTQMQTQTGQFSGQQVPTITSGKNALINSGSGALNRYAEGLEKEIQNNAPYVLVPGGKTFYVCLEQPADMQISSIPLAQDPEATERVRDLNQMSGKPSPTQGALAAPEYLREKLSALNSIYNNGSNANTFDK